MKDPYFIVEPQGEKVPVIVSVPHSGTAFPEELKTQFLPARAAAPDDTDWFVHRLYDFASVLGITVIHARYSRWVIDLNRDPTSRPLYDDGRIITALTPATDFLGNEIYTDKKFVPSDREIERRLELYYRPYHRKIESLLAERIEKFGRVLLWDAHSIRQLVPTIRPEPFPDLILGDDDGRSAGQEIIRIALETLRGGGFQVTHNTPFKGGFITRNFGDPENNVHALQLEMAKIHYMDDAEQQFDEARAERIREILRPVFERLIEYLIK